MRNNDVRGADLSSRTAAARQEAQASLQEICNIQAQMDPRVQNLLFKDLTEHLTRKRSIIKIGLQCATLFPTEQYQTPRRNQFKTRDRSRMHWLIWLYKS